MNKLITIDDKYIVHMYTANISTEDLSLGRLNSS